MKDKILTFIIGALVGAVITAGGFLVYMNINKDNNVQTRNNMQMMGEPPQMNGGMEMDRNNIPEKPLDENSEETTTEEKSSNKKTKQGNNQEQQSGDSSSSKSEKQNSKKQNSTNSEEI